jgi:predicted site-specific integrase-resolvase
VSKADPFKVRVMEEHEASYARVRTKDQTVDLQVDAVRKAGCTKVYTEVMNGSRAERPILSNLFEHLAPETCLSFGSSIASGVHSNAGSR